MDLKIETVKTALGAAAGYAIKLFGGNYKLAVLLIAAIVIDTIFGHLKAVHNKQWSSYNARWGMISKLIELVLVALMQLVEWTFDIHWLANAVVVYFIICEGASIIENIVQGNLNENIPDGIIELLSKAKSNVAAGIIKKVKKIFEDGEEKSQ